MLERQITADPATLSSAAPRHRRRWPWLLAGVVVLAGAGAVAWRWQAPPRAPVATAPIPVLTVSLATAATRPTTAIVTGDGSVVAWQDIVISAEIGGLRLLEIPVEEGQSVRQGDLLARLDDGLLGPQAAQAEAATREARAALDIARSDLARAETLARSQTGSVQLAEQRRSAALQAEARLASAQARQAEAAARLAQTRILAPADGLVAKVTPRIGSVTAMGQEMLRILRDGRLELDARVPELDLPQLRPGQAVTVLHGARRIAGEVRAVAPLVAADTRLGLVHVALPAGSGLLPGMFARAEIAGPTRPVVMVPAAAAVFRDGAPHVFVLAEGADRVAIRRIRAGAREDGLVQVLDGLAPGERVVISGAGFLGDGDLVRVSP